MPVAASAFTTSGARWRIHTVVGVNMEPFKRILVDVDATATAHPALERAVRLAQSSGATITIADVMAVPPHASSYLPATLEEDIVRHQRQQLARIANGVTGVQRSRSCWRPACNRPRSGDSAFEP